VISRVAAATGWRRADQKRWLRRRGLALSLFCIAQRTGRDFAEGAETMEFIIWLIVGGVAGWLAGLIVRGYGFGLLGNIIVGIVGALVAGWLLPQLGIMIGGGTLGEIINAVIGAVILLLIIGLIRR
jgi:uncharacterized membrane protein YeaQ/YmgE (transglycosylase-associated protein family)